jgi:cholesterol oxidase
MIERFDAVIIGSGFGGAVTAARLSEKNMKVLVLERGRRWLTNDFPREPQDAWAWDPDFPQEKNGWFDIRFYQNMAVAMGAGVGGGSLVYANVFVPAKPEAFDEGWPPEINYNELKPYYDIVGRMLDVQYLPDNQLTRRYMLMKEGAKSIGHKDRFKKLPLAVHFSKDWHYQLDDPFNEAHSKSFFNEQGVEQGTCIHCGNCDIGCRVKAKNTLDLNYIALAEKHGAQVRPLHLVSHLSKEHDHYVVHYKRIQDKSLFPGRVSAKIVVLAAGSLGSTEILLRSRDQYNTLPRLSDYLGKDWSSNGDFLTPGFYEDDRKISPTWGPTITCAIDFLDGSQNGLRYFIEDGGFPDLLGNYLEEMIEKGSSDPLFHSFLDSLARILRGKDRLGNVMPWFAQGMDEGGGELKLKRLWYAPWRWVLDLKWDVDRARKVINGIVDMHKRLSEATGGKAWVPPPWELFGYLVTPHPLGGCNMGSDPATGVVNHLGEVFGYTNLYVADGAIIPQPIGLNPSRTIAALAERIAAHIENK